MTCTTVSVQRPLRGRDELHDLATSGALELAGGSTEAVLTWAVATFGHRLAVASSMTDGVLPNLVGRRLPGVHVVFLDTGYHFAETLRTRDEVARLLPIEVIDVRAARTVAEQDDAEGPDLFARDPGRCCALRKVAPLNRALSGYEAWVSGVRHADGGARSDARAVEWDERRGIVKINPIVGWTDQDVSRYVADHGIPVNPLVAAGYPSIGCRPCTRAVGAGQDSRAGRWAGQDKTECGIHQ